MITIKSTCPACGAELSGDANNILCDICGIEFTAKINIIMSPRQFKRIRKSKYLRQDQLCKLLNISQATVANYEIGAYLIKPAIMRKMIEINKCSAIELIRRVEG